MRALRHLRGRVAGVSRAMARAAPRRGTGRGSVACFAVGKRFVVSLHIGRLKIDRSFVSGIATSRENQALISALIGIGRALSIDIVVEGVEKEEEAEILRMLGCRHAQGYLFARPMPDAEIPRWLNEHAARNRPLAR